MPKFTTCSPACERAPGGRLFLSRRGLGRLVLAGLTIGLAGCDNGGKWHAIDVSHSSPALSFTMARTPDGKQVSAADYRGKLMLLYFGYTFCPDVCPTTLLNLAKVLDRLGPAAAHVRVLFVTVDPNRDTLAVLGQYVANFAPQIVGLRGTSDELTALARRYRVVYSVSPATEDHPYEVTHSSAIYVFDETGAARLLIPSMATDKPDIAGTVADLRRLLDERDRPGLLTRLERLV